MSSSNPPMNDYIIARPIRQEPNGPAAASAGEADRAAAVAGGATSSTATASDPRSDTDRFLESSPDWMEIEDVELSDIDFELETEAEVTLSGAIMQEDDPAGPPPGREPAGPVHPWSVSVMAFPPAEAPRGEEEGLSGDGSLPGCGRRFAQWAGTVVRRLRAPFIKRPAELPFVIDPEEEMAGLEREAGRGGADQVGAVAATIPVVPPGAPLAAEPGEDLSLEVGPALDFARLREEHRSALLECGDVLVRLATIASSPRFEELPKEARSLSMRLALEVAGIDAGSLCEEVRAMRGALQSHDDSWRARIDRLEQVVQRRNTTIEEVTTRFVQAQCARQQANLQLVREARSSFAQWQGQRAEEEARLARILELLEGARPAGAPDDAA